MEKKWYVIHTYSGYENKVKANLEHRVESMGMEDKIFRVLVPMEEEMEFKDGKRRLTKKKIYPLCNCGDDHDGRFLVCCTQHTGSNRVFWHGFLARSPAGALNGFDPAANGDGRTSLPHGL